MIRQELQQWYKATNRLHLLIAHVTEDNREETIEQIHQLLTLRDQLQSAIRAVCRVESPPQHCYFCPWYNFS